MKETKLGNQGGNGIIIKKISLLCYNFLIRFRYTFSGYQI